MSISSFEELGYFFKARMTRILSLFRAFLRDLAGMLLLLLASAPLVTVATETCFEVLGGLLLLALD